MDDFFGILATWNDDPDYGNNIWTGHTHDDSIQYSYLSRNYREGEGYDLSLASFNGIGDPVSDCNFWHYQTHPTSCDVVAQASIFESLTGNHLSEDQALQIAVDNGVWSPATGTSAENMGKLLDILGVQTETSWGNSVQSLAEHLNNGDKVIVAVNANEIWHPVHDTMTGLPMPQKIAGHAVWVTGIEQQADGSFNVILNDSGTPDGKSEVVPLGDFQQAWSEYGNEMVIAHAPAGLGSHDWTSVANSGFLYERVNGSYTGNYTKA